MVEGRVLQQRTGEGGGEGEGETVDNFQNTY